MLFVLLVNETILKSTWGGAVVGYFSLEKAIQQLRVERIKMPKRGVNWAFLKINCKN
jgi:hypothetical protein